MRRLAVGQFFQLRGDLQKLFLDRLVLRQELVRRGVPLHDFILQARDEVLKIGELGFKGLEACFDLVPFHCRSIYEPLPR